MCAPRASQILATFQRQSQGRPRTKDVRQGGKILRKWWSGNGGKEEGLCVTKASVAVGGHSVMLLGI